MVQNIIPVEARSVLPKFSLMNHFWHSKWGTLFTYSNFTYSYSPCFGQSLNIKIKKKKGFLALSEYYFEYECTNRYILQLSCLVSGLSKKFDRYVMYTWRMNRKLNIDTIMCYVTCRLKHSINTVSKGSLVSLTLACKK